ncbi:toxin-antitoxin system YwqK family antitoxin [Streptomyces echinoruber]|uniref:MORN repeat variant n=1 Tax=Streptomyces echinoruber TaxID=68898 RepID=A0A918R119_9ACTN|nr:hypothetical protein [Streptomyces echinoruber]GGZ80762.1 hypothetical protein GCM10010389_18290 [Streptomyces echinoruber]
MRRINVGDPEVDIDYDHRLLYADEPFTGEAEEYLNGHRVSLAMYKDGYPDGPYREWYEDGVLRAEGVMRMGLVSGEFKRWHPNGVLAAKQVFAENGMTLLEDRTWDEHGRPTRTWRKGA